MVRFNRVKGAILAVTLIILAALSVILVSVAFTNIDISKSARAMLSQSRAKMCAMSGLESGLVAVIDNLGSSCSGSGTASCSGFWTSNIDDVTTKTESWWLSDSTRSANSLNICSSSRFVIERIGTFTSPDKSFYRVTGWGKSVEGDVAYTQDPFVVRNN